MPRIVLLALALAACSDGRGDDPTTSSTSSPASLGEVTATGGLSDASCEATDHPLAVRCELTSASSDTVTWTVREAGDGGDVQRTLVTDGTVHQVLLWGLAAQTDYVVEAVGSDGQASGALTAGSHGLEGLSIVTTGATDAFDSVLVPLQCDDTSGLVSFDAEGRVTWFAHLAPGSTDMRGGISGFAVSPDGFVAGLQGDGVVEVGVDGSELRFVQPSEVQHHDLTVDEQGRIYVVDARQVDGYVLDGVEIFSGTESVARFDLADVITPSGTTGGDMFWANTFPGAIDYTHTNSVELGPDGTGLLSLKAQNTVMQVVLDPDAADFGSVDWVLAGDDSDLSATVAFTDGGGFTGQHHASWSSDGTVLLFDNGASTSRGLELFVDPDAGTATELRSVGVGERCPVQGATYELPDGGLLTTCANSGEIVAHDASGSERWSATVSCGSQAPLARGIPLQWADLGF
jgi:hypothetical protein